MRRLKMSPLAIVLILVVCVAGLVGLAQQYWIGHRVSQDVARLKVIVSSLKTDPEFSDLRVVRSTHPAAWIFGTVETSVQLDVVRKRVAESFSADETRRMVSHIRLLRPTTQESGVQNPASLP